MELRLTRTMLGALNLAWREIRAEAEAVRFHADGNMDRVRDLVATAVFKMPPHSDWTLHMETVFADFERVVAGRARKGTLDISGIEVMVAHVLRRTLASPSLHPRAREELTRALYPIAIAAGESAVDLLADLAEDVT